MPEAIRIFESRDDIRVLVTDIDMPGSMDGLKLAPVVWEKWPQVKLVVVSGKKAPRLEELPADALFYGKPYDMDEVTAAVRKLLAT